MYYAHFGLRGAPFQITSSPHVLYWGAEHLKAFAALEWGLQHEQSGFTVLVGEVGTGKTTLAMAILAREYQNVRTAYISNSKLSFDEIFRDIMRQLGVRSPGRTRLTQINAFESFLSRLSTHERVVIILDEAQGLSDETLEEVRLLSNSGPSSEKQLHFVLIGQTELARRLNTSGLRQLNQRIGARAVLNPLGRAEARAYVEERLCAVGGAAGKVFTAGALRYLLRFSERIPRRINVLCHNAMLLAYGNGAKKVDKRMARAAVSEYGNLFATLRPERSAGAIRTAFSRVIESIALVLLSGSHRITPQAEPAPALTAERPLRARPARPARRTSRKLSATEAPAAATSNSVG